MNVNKEKREPTERELEERVNRSIRGAYGFLDDAVDAFEELRRRRQDEEEQGRIETE